MNISAKAHSECFAAYPSAPRSLSASHESIQCQAIRRPQPHAGGVRRRNTVAHTETETETEK